MLSNKIKKKKDLIEKVRRNTGKTQQLLIQMKFTGITKKNHTTRHSDRRTIRTPDPRRYNLSQ